MCPRKLFTIHLVQFITDSIDSGLEVILTADANEHVVKGKVDMKLYKLGIVEAYCDKFKSTGTTS